MLKLNNISYNFPAFSLKNVSFRVEKGEYFILLGMSGAGKSVLLEMIAGLTYADSGTIMIDGKSVEKSKPDVREVGLVFQDHAIFPHLTVEGNIGFALKNLKTDRTTKSGMIRAIAERLRIGHLLKRHPASLSGGELQRVALARTLVQKPKVLLLDEPLAAIDTRLKTEIRSLLRQLNREGQTIVHVTHDFDEAISLAHRLAIIQEGQIIQTGTPSEIFGKPQSEFVAHFVGIQNFFDCTITESEEGCQAETGNGVKLITTCPARPGRGKIMVHGKDIELSGTKWPDSFDNCIAGTVLEASPSRNGIEVLIDIGIEMHASVKLESARNLNLSENTQLWVRLEPSSVIILQTE